MQFLTTFFSLLPLAFLVTRVAAAPIASVNTQDLAARNFEDSHDLILRDLNDLADILEARIFGLGKKDTHDQKDAKVQKLNKEWDKTVQQKAKAGTMGDINKVAQKHNAKVAKIENGRGAKVDIHFSGDTTHKPKFEKAVQKEWKADGTLQRNYPQADVHATKKEKLSVASVRYHNGGIASSSSAHSIRHK